MDRQIVISIGREYGSGGHEIGMKLAEKLGIEFIDRSLLASIAENTDLSYETFEKYDEKPKKIFSRTVRGYSNSPEQNVAELQFSLLKSKAVRDDSFVIVGRCSDELFKEICPCISIFISAERRDKVKRVMKRTEKSEKEAGKLIDKVDKTRASYHDYYCKSKWGMSSSYDICINSSVLGIDGSVEFLYSFVKSYLSKFNK